MCDNTAHGKDMPANSGWDTAMLPCPQASSWIEKFCWLPQAELAKAHKSRQELQHRMRNVVSSFNEAAQGVEERKRRMKERRKMVRRR